MPLNTWLNVVGSFRWKCERMSSIKPRCKMGQNMMVRTRRRVSCLLGRKENRRGPTTRRAHSQSLRCCACLCVSPRPAARQAPLFTGFSSQECGSGLPRPAARQAPLFTGFSSQECGSGLPFPPPGALLNPGIEPMSPGLTGGFFTNGSPGKPLLSSSQG